MKVYGIQQTRQDADNRDYGVLWDEDMFYGTEAPLAQFWVDILNYGRHVFARRDFERRVAEAESNKKEYTALFEAGLREKSWDELPGRWTPRLLLPEDYWVSEHEVVFE